MSARGLIFAINNSMYDVAKDLWYNIKVILVFTVGLMVGFTSQPDRDWLRITAIYAAISLAITWVFWGYEVMAGGDSEILPELMSIFVIIFYLQATWNRAKSQMPKWLWASFLLPWIILAKSRVIVVVFLIAWAGAARLFRTRTRIALGLISLFTFVYSVPNLLPQYDVSNITFVGKIQNSISELSFVDSDNVTDITANWRGFEATKAFEMWQNGSLGEKIFGHGLGAPIDIGIYYKLFEDYSVRELPIIHNGYFMVLVKYGVLGSIFFVVFMMSPFFLPRQKKGLHSELQQSMGRAASGILLVTTLVITGPLNLSGLDGMVLVMGWAIGQQRQISLSDQLRFSILRSPEPQIPRPGKLGIKNRAATAV
jgi:hypothetical protein